MTGVQWDQQGQGSSVPLQPLLPHRAGVLGSPPSELWLCSALGPMGTRRNLVPDFRVSRGERS